MLVDGDDFNEPITDTARSILDGHIMLDRKLGHKNHYPAIDILQSISRCMSQIAAKDHKQAAGKLKNVLATYAEAEDIISSTSFPLSLKYSAMAVAVLAALFLSRAGLSEVATTTTERRMPSSPRSLSMNSRTSLPRSPIRAMTLISRISPQRIFGDAQAPGAGRMRGKGFHHRPVYGAGVIPSLPHIPYYAVFCPIQNSLRSIATLSSKLNFSSTSWPCWTGN